MIPFNRPHLTGMESALISEALATGKLSGDGLFTKRCHEFFKKRFGFQKPLLTTSCTDALEMAAILCDIQPGDEVIVPSFTFVSTANAFVLRGARVVFADSRAEEPDLDCEHIEELITPRTKAVVPVHYAGISCDMDRLLAIARPRGIRVVEDAAQAIDASYKGRPLGGIGDLATFSFHETKNISSGEGGMLTVNNPDLQLRAEIIREKGTNRCAFFRGEVDKYSWVDIGSSFLPSEITAAFLYAQLTALESIQDRRKQIWNSYLSGLSSLRDHGDVRLPMIPSYATNNAHMFYLLCDDLDIRSRLIEHLKRHGIMAVFHYVPLHSSPFYASRHDGRTLENADRFSDQLLRLPLFYDMTEGELRLVISTIFDFFGRRM